MDSEALLALDSSLESVTGKCVRFSRLGDGECVEEDALLFVKNMAFLDKLKRGLQGKRVHLIVATSLYEASQREIAQVTDSVFLTPNLDLTISLVSKGFYDELFGEVNHFVDGRQMGTATVDPSTTMAQHIFLGEGVSVGKHCIIHPHVSVMAKAQVGDFVELFPGVVLYPRVVLGNSVRVHANSVVGSDGLGYNFVGEKHHKIWHTGSVVVEEGVEIGANTCIDGGTFSPTVIGEGTKIDNQVHIGHNCKIGKCVMICGHVGLGGSVRIGDFSVLGGKAGVGHGLTLGKGCQIAGAAQVTGDCPDGAKVAGHPARPLGEWLRGVAYLRRESLGGGRSRP